MDAMALFTQVYAEIMDTVRRSGGGRWNYEKLVPGPLSYEMLGPVSRVAWIYDPGTNPVRIYANQNHPAWQGKTFR